MHCCVVLARLVYLDGHCQRSRVQWKLSWPQWANFHFDSPICTTREPVLLMKSQVQAPGPRRATCIIDDEVFNLAHAQPVHMLIVQCITKSSVYIVYNYCSAWVHKAAAWAHWLLLLLACMWAAACSQVWKFIQSAWSSHNHHRGYSTKK